MANIPNTDIQLPDDITLEDINNWLNVHNEDWRAKNIMAVIAANPPFYNSASDSIKNAIKYKIYTIINFIYEERELTRKDQV